MEKIYDLCLEVLKRLQKSGILYYGFPKKWKLKILAALKDSEEKEIFSLLYD
jgi:hypothetical protein